jgi:hypothetical protein
MHYCTCRCQSRTCAAIRGEWSRFRSDLRVEPPNFEFSPNHKSCNENYADRKEPAENPPDHKRHDTGGAAYAAASISGKIRLFIQSTASCALAAALKIARLSFRSAFNQDAMYGAWSVRGSVGRDNSAQRNAAPNSATSSSIASFRTEPAAKVPVSVHFLSNGGVVPISGLVPRRLGIPQGPR